MNNREFKMVKLESKNDFIIYLNQLITSMFKKIQRMRWYMEEQEELIKKYKLTETENRGIPTRVYFSCLDKWSAIFAESLNLIGDETRLAASYRKWRKMLDKKRKTGQKEFLDVDDLDDNLKKLINEFNSLRNWALHVPESMFYTQREYMNMQFSHLELNVTTLLSGSTLEMNQYLYQEGDWLIMLNQQSKNFYHDFQKVFQRMRKDYSQLIGRKMEIKKVQRNKPRSIMSTYIPTASYQIQEGSYKPLFTD